MDKDKPKTEDILRDLIKSLKEQDLSDQIFYLTNGLKSLGWEKIGLFTYSHQMEIDQSFVIGLDKKILKKLEPFRLKPDGRHRLIVELNKRDTFFIPWDDQFAIELNPSDNILDIFKELGYDKKSSPKGLFIPLLKQNKSIGSMHIVRVDGANWNRHLDILELYVTYAIYIIDQYQLSRELESSRNQYQSLFQDSRDILVVIDGNFKIQLFNKQFVKFIKEDESNIKGRSFKDYLIVKSKTFDNAVKMVFSGKENIFESQIALNSGAIKYIRINLSPRKLKDKQTLVHMVIHDITVEKDLEMRAKGSENLYKLLFENAIEGIALLDTDGTFISVNSEGLKQTGYYKNELIGKNIIVLSNERSKEITKKIFNRIAKGITLKNKRIFITRRDGSIKTLSISSSPLRSETGEIVGVFLMSRDITDIDEALKAKEKSEKQYKTLAENIPVGIYRSLPDDNSTLITVNTALIKLLGARNENEAKKIPVVTIYEDPESRRCLIESLKKDGYVRDFESRIRRLDGSIIWVAENAHATKDFKGNILYIDGTIRDITASKELEQELIESEKRYRLIAENISDVIWSMDLDLNLIYISPSVEQMHGYTAEELIKLPVEKIITPESYQLALSKFEEALELQKEDSTQRRRSYTLELQTYRKDGTIFWIEVSASFLLNENGLPVGIHGISRDISERRKAEEDLKQSEERFRQVTENIREVFWLEDVLTNKLIYISPAFDEIWGRDRHSLLNDEINFLQTVHDSDREKVSQTMPRYPIIYDDREYRIKRPNDEIRWIHEKAFPVKDKTGKVYRIAGVALDVTERKAAEELLRESEEKYRKLVELTTDIICLEQNDIIEFINTSGARLLKADDPSKIHGTSLLNYIHTNYKNKVKEMISTASAIDRIPEHLEAVLLCLDGSEIDVDFHAVPLKIGDRKSTQIIAHDISYRKKVEAEREDQLKLLDEKVKDRTKELAQANKELIRSNKIKSEFLANISHELRSPLTSILGYTEMLQSYNTNQTDQRKFLDILSTQGTQLLRLVNSLLDLTKLEAGTARLELSTTGINDLIIMVKKHLQLKLKKVSINLELQLDERIEPVFLDGQKVYQIIRNLIDNGIKFSQKNSTLIVKSQLFENEIQIKVIDQGIGIPDSKMPYIFDPFYQVDGSSTRSYEGAGLGLHIAKSYVEMHHGRIWVESTINKGSTFTVCLPVNLKPSNVDDESFDYIQKDYLKRIAKNKRSILIVDDDQEIVNLIKIMLHGKYEVYSAYNGKDGVKKAIELKPSLIFMDLSMPVLDGYEATKLITQNEETRDIPIIALSARAMKSEVLKAIQVGCTDHIAKPFKLNTLQEIINRFVK